MIAGGTLRGDKAKPGHQSPGMFKARQISGLGEEPDGCNQTDTSQGL